MNARSYKLIIKDPGLATKLEQMAFPLAPLVEVQHGTVHPAFPRTVLLFWLLTNEQLESLAEFYHQRTPNEFTNLYPHPIRDWNPDMAIEEKQRKVGEFIGIRFCDSRTLKTDEDIMAEVRQAAEKKIWRKFY
ncbi:hypothetical protein B0J13DRAFT_150149 [Dactylonectria estremocensis]|uniref:Uncharacterized protein n=1 Tax=Dactylonectria estremocensis TaxID=1079267 RepID=A0A9P9IJW3_9HYPO|nr:hypothetical protein B0J13DRAFT_150149 [Dactylonectria estremocensis]